MSDTAREQVETSNKRGLNGMTEIAQQLHDVVVSDAPQLAGGITALVRRLEEHRFEIAVVGEFNRGKSTLLNLLLDNMVLPSGALPVTSTLTELTYGDAEQARVTFGDGTEEFIDLTAIENYVTEEANPGNQRNVASVSVAMPSKVLQHGAVLVDTPGVGSIFRHNSDTAREAVTTADAAIVVLSADTPITEAERSLIKMLSRRSERTFFVLNRIDHLDPEERQKVTWFIESVLESAYGSEQRLYVMSARTREGFEEFANDFETFLVEQLGAARVSLACRDLQLVADQIDNECALEESAHSLDSGALDERVNHFNRAVAWQRDSFADDVVLFQNAMTRMHEELRERVAPAATIDEATRARVQRLLEDAPQATLAESMRRTIEAELHSTVEPLRRREETEVERTWTKAAERFERATLRRADKLRDIAGDLFSVDLKPVPLTQPSSQTGHFFYASAQDFEPQTSVFGRIAGVFSSKSRRRQRLIEATLEQLNAELRRHVERLVQDLTDRANESGRELEKQMATQVGEITEAMSSAIERGQARKDASLDEQQRLLDRNARLRQAAATARRAADEELSEVVTLG